MKWHRELRAQMIDEKFPEIANESITTKWVIRGLANHAQFSQLVTSWRASGPPSSLSELEAILSNEEAEIDRARRVDGQLQALLRQVNRRPPNSYSPQQQHNQQKQNPPPNSPPAQNKNQQPNLKRGRGRGIGGIGRGRGNNNQQPRHDANANLAQKIETLQAQLAEMREKA